jgi:outer membrane receptor protein involved in Fe transport
LLVGSTAIAMAVAALAAPTGPARAQEAGQAPAAQTVQEVVVTGSRIARRDFTANSPIVTVSSSAFENTSQVAVENTLNKLPQFQAGLNNQIAQAQQVQPSATSTPGTSALNLRGLGPNRTLVLVDGMRFQPANALGFVDINAIPSSIIDNVEVVTGGASAIYGADAVAGVVNFKLKQNFQGLTLDAQYGLSQRGDDREPHVAAIFGSNFADNRGNVTAGVDYYQRSIVLQKDRPFYLAGFNDPGTNAGGSYPFLPYASYDWGANASFVGLDFVLNSPSAAAINAIFGPGVYPLGPGGGSSVSVNPNQTLFYSGKGANGAGAPGYTGPLQPGFKIQTSNGSLGANNLTAPLSLPLTRWALFESAHYDITDDITAYTEGSFTQTQAKTSVLASPAVQFWGAAVPHDAAHPVPAQLEALLNSRNGGVDGVGFIPGVDLGLPIGPHSPWSLQLQMDNVLGPRTTIDTSYTYNIVAGLKGKLPYKDWTWNVFGTHGQTSAFSNLVSGFGSTKQWQALLALPNYGQNGTIAGVAQQSVHCTSGFYGAIFQGARPSQDCIDAITTQLKTETELTQNVVEADFTGSLFELPAGTLKFAAGGDYREEVFSYSPDPLLDTTSISDAPIGLFPSAPVGGRVGVSEGYGELLVPVLKDMPGAQSLDLDLAGRYSSYTWSGGNPFTNGGVSGWTYMAQANWKVNPWISFRGGYQLAVRAPNVAELFQPITAGVVFANAGDPCASTTPVPWGNNASNPNRLKTQQLCLALIQPTNPNAGSTFYVPGGSANTYTGLFPFFFPVTIDHQFGNPNLKPETAHTWTAGIVLRSPIEGPLWNRFQASMDWYSIKIVGAINPVTSEVSYEQCLNANGASNPSLTVTGSPFCANIQREAVTGGNRFANAPFANLGGLKTEGMDFHLTWGADFAAMGMSSVPGSLLLDWQLNWLWKYDVQTTPGGQVLDYAGTVNGAGGSSFRYKMFTTLTWANSWGSLGLTWLHLPSARDASVVVTPTSTTKGPGAYDEFNLFGTYKLNDRYEFRAGVDNLFDKDPLVIGAIPGTTNAQGLTIPDYDVLGRRFYVGMRARF